MPVCSSISHRRSWARCRVTKLTDRRHDRRRAGRHDQYHDAQAPRLRRRCGVARAWSVRTTTSTATTVHAPPPWSAARLAATTMGILARRNVRRIGQSPEDSVYSNGDWRSDVTHAGQLDVAERFRQIPSITCTTSATSAGPRVRKKSATNARVQQQPTDQPRDQCRRAVLRSTTTTGAKGLVQRADELTRAQNRITNPVISEHNHHGGRRRDEPDHFDRSRGLPGAAVFITGGVKSELDVRRQDWRIFAEVAHTKAERTSDQQNMGMTQTGNDFSFDLVGADDAAYQHGRAEPGIR